MIGVSEENVQDNQEFLTKMKLQNSVFKNVVDDKIKFVRTYKPKNKRKFNVILEIHSQYLTPIICNKYVYIGWDSCRVFEFINVRRCFKCWKYGHKADKNTIKQ